MITRERYSQIGHDHYHCLIVSLFYCTITHVMPIISHNKRLCYFILHIPSPPWTGLCLSFFNLHRSAISFLSRFKDVVECERIVVKAFATTHEVGSFRASKLSDDFYQLRAMLEQRRATMITQSDATRDQTRDLLTGMVFFSLAWCRNRILI